MKFFNDKVAFNEEMRKVMEILNEKGYLMESDHKIAYYMQYRNAFDDVKKWLEANDYDGELDTLGAYHKVAVYGLYDKSRISYGEMEELLKKEAESQNQISCIQNSDSSHVESVVMLSRT